MRSSVRLLVGVIFFISCLWIPTSNYGPELRIYALNVGQGDSTLIITPDNVKVLIDGGPDQSVISELDAVIPFWDRSIDAIMLTHPDADHVGGLNDVVERFKVGEVYWTKIDGNGPAFTSFAKKIKDEDIKSKTFMRADQIHIGDGVTIKGLWPIAPQNKIEKITNINTTSQVVLLEYHSFTGLFTGDINTEVANTLQSIHSLPDVDYLKVPHHGSKYGFEEDQLQELSPLISTISVSDDNHYGHPSANTIEKLRQSKTKIYQTNQQGRISIRVNYSGISVTSE